MRSIFTYIDSIIFVNFCENLNRLKNNLGILLRRFLNWELRKVTQKGAFYIHHRTNAVEAWSLIVNKFDDCLCSF